MLALQRTIEASVVPVLLVGRDLRIACANRAAHELLGYPPGDLNGLPMVVLLGPRRQGEMRNFEQLLSGGGARRWRSSLRCRDGRLRTLALALAAHHDEGQQVLAFQVRLEPVQGDSLGASEPAGSPPTHSGLRHSQLRGKPAGRQSDTLPERLPPVPPPDAPVAPVHALTSPPPALKPPPGLPAPVGSLLMRAQERLAELERTALTDTPALEGLERASVLRAVREIRELLDEALQFAGE